LCACACDCVCVSIIAFVGCWLLLVGFVCWSLFVGFVGVYLYMYRFVSLAPNTSPPPTMLPWKHRDATFSHVFVVIVIMVGFLIAFLNKIMILLEGAKIANCWLLPCYKLKKNMARMSTLS